MKKQMIKTFITAMTAGAVLTGVPVSVLAEEDNIEAYLLGEWSDGLDEYVFTSDGRMYIRNMMEFDFYCEYEIEDDRIIMDTDTMPREEMEGVEDPEATAEFVDITAEYLREIDKEYDNEYYYAEEGTDKIMEITVSMTDGSDPLNPETVSNTLYLVKSREVENYLTVWLQGKTWDLDGKKLAVGEVDEVGKMPITLDGTQTGTLEVYGDGSLYFSWDGGDTIQYAYVTSDEDGITIQKDEDPGSKLVLKPVYDDAEDVSEDKSDDADDTADALEENAEDTDDAAEEIADDKEDMDDSVEDKTDDIEDNTDEVKEDEDE